MIYTADFVFEDGNGSIANGKIAIYLTPGESKKDFEVQLMELSEVSYSDYLSDSFTLTFSGKGLYYFFANIEKNRYISIG